MKAVYNDHPYGTVAHRGIVRRHKAGSRRPRLTDGVEYPVTVRRIAS